MDFSHIPALLLIGFAILAGSVGARLFQWLRIPQVVGYIVIGVIVGKTGFGLIDDVQLEGLLPFNFFALGIIGFLIGGELHLSVFKRHGSQFLKILLAESFGAFLVVTALVVPLVYVFTRSFPMALSFGLLLGAISSATAPAATVDVLWEHKTRGMLTTTVLAIVALDDGVALILYSLASSVALALTGGQHESVVAGLLSTGANLGGAILLGVAAGFLLNRLVRRIHDHGKHLTFIVGVLTLVLGISLFLDIDVILAAMTLGATLVNLAPNRSRETFKLVERFSPPIYVLFFVFVGARLSIHGLSGWMWWVVVVYVVGRTGGKLLGANLGARWAGAAVAVRRYLGLCLFSQAGVAIGLAILAGLRFSDQMIGNVSVGDAIVMIVTTTTFLVQMVGPPFVQLAVTRAGEVGLNVTEEDLMGSYKVADVMLLDTPSFTANSRVTDIIRAAADSQAMSYPVVDADGRVLGLVTLEDLKQCLADVGMGEWVIAFDVMRSVPETVELNGNLAEAVQRMRDTALEALPVVDSTQSGKLVGLLELRATTRKVAGEVLRRRRRADESIS